ncbi:hypothetical protein [Flammeovirga kamogawensis]|uniref:Beta-agarase n=1 Tax=Flammeovirga kamogawensis TaxID=373891 RepID=A0ABX8H132_9BACT|nr:hypothetical protein [Flammeovirga kamogawensis]MBB6463254.1 hypothetical protein [Flammeovirga kamogawensis]QWG09595.1 hypothetical protein KM029_23595 [Flammeovirga kamogawensis]TRX65110.1 hypothetical protein EO216_21495 [Flammeovirga kamogawensis]
MKNCYLTLLLLFTAIVSNAQANQTFDLFDFTKRADAKKITISGDATSEIKSSGFQITTAKNGSSVMKIVGDWDLHEWLYVAIILENKTEEVVRFEPIIKGELTSDFKAPIPLKNIGWLNPKETRVFDCTLQPDVSTRSTIYADMNEDFPEMQGMPAGISFKNSFDLTHTKSIEIYFPVADFERVITVKAIELYKHAYPENYEKNHMTFFPFVDQYGQYKYATWNGKIKNDKQLQDDIKTEDEDLAKNQGSEEWTKYGGYKLGPKLEVTGHFYTAKVQDKWWLVDPEGFLFWSNGVNGAADLSVNSQTSDKDLYFEYLPMHTDANFGKFWDGSDYNFGHANIKRKYGEYDSQKYAIRSMDRMKSWGLNTMGAWSYAEAYNLPEEKKSPYTLAIESEAPDMVEGFPDVYNHHWERNLHKEIKHNSHKIKKDPFFIGWFVDDELKWHTPEKLVTLLIQNNSHSHAKKHYLQHLQKAGEDVISFNKATGKSFKTWKEVMASQEELDLSSFSELNKKFYAQTAHKYFKTVKKYITELSPGSLYLGCRWDVQSEHRNNLNVSIGAKYIDILSFNQFDDEIYPNTFPTLSGIDKPYIISEFNFGSLDSGKFSPGLSAASDQRNRGEKYKNFVESAMRDKNCVGAHWFMWGNAATTGTSKLGENANCGILTETDQPYYQLIDYMRDVNYTMYKYRYSNEGQKAAKQELK